MSLFASEARNKKIHVQQAARQRGSAMIEFVVVGPTLTLLGLVILQYALMFNAKNLANHATFMAARAGAMGNADLSAVKDAYTRALIPLYGGGRDSAELATAYAKAAADVAIGTKVELLNPTKESFDDWSDDALKDKYGVRAIPNGGLSFKDPNQIKSNSGQSIQDANLIKVKITLGYEMKVPLASTMIQFMLRWADSGSDPIVSAMYQARRIPLVSHATLQMQSDAKEPGNPISIAGLGNNGNPSDPGFTEPPVKAPPRCMTAGCTVVVSPTAPNPGTGTTPPPLYGCPPGDPGCSPLCGA